MNRKKKKTPENRREKTDRKVERRKERKTERLFQWPFIMVDNDSSRWVIDDGCCRLMYVDEICAHSSQSDSI